MSIYSDAWEILKEKPILKPHVPCPACDDTKTITKGSGAGRIGAYTIPCYCVNWNKWLQVLNLSETRGPK